MIYTFDTEKMTIIERELLEELLQQRAIRIRDWTPFPEETGYQIRLSIEPRRSIHYLRLSKKIKEKYDTITLNERNNAPEAMRKEKYVYSFLPLRKGDPVIIQERTTKGLSNFTIWIKDIPSAKPFIDLLFESELNILLRDRHGNPEYQTGAKAFTERLKESCKHYEKDRERRELGSRF